MTDERSDAGFHKESAVRWQFVLIVTPYVVVSPFLYQIQEQLYGIPIFRRFLFFNFSGAILIAIYTLLACWIVLGRSPWWQKCLGTVMAVAWLAYCYDLWKESHPMAFW